MMIEKKNFSEFLFNGLDYDNYIKKNKIAELVGVNLTEYGDTQKNLVLPPFFAVDPKYLDEPLPPELGDLSRLHWLVRTRKVTTILEFGLGKSTIIFNDAILKNKISFNDYIIKNLRRSNPFECHSVDNYEKWIDEIRKKNKLDSVIYHKSKVVMSTFSDRVCTYYDPLPNISPDFIYLDGPSIYAPEGDIRGLSTRHKDSLPMAADILSIEHFLLPGTLIVIDGRTANARFLKSNLQRCWTYCHDESFDQHYFELTEMPLGIYNRRQIEYCLGETYFARLN